MDETPFRIAVDLAAMHQHALEIMLAHLAAGQGHLDGYDGDIMFGEHHESHAASAFFPSPFEQAAVVTIDGGMVNSGSLI